PRPKSKGTAMPCPSEPRLLLLLPTATYRATAFVEAARRLGVALTVASELPSTFEQAQPAGLVTLDFSDPERAAQQATEFARSHPIAGHRRGRRWRRRGRRYRRATGAQGQSAGGRARRPRQARAAAGAHTPRRAGAAGRAARTRRGRYAARRACALPLRAEAAATRGLTRRDPRRR